MFFSSLLDTFEPLTILLNVFEPSSIYIQTNFVLFAEVFNMN